MSKVQLDVDILLQWNDETAAAWEKFFAENSAALDLPCDIAVVGKTDDAPLVRDLVKHIAAAELRYAQRLRDVAITAYEELENSSEAIFAVHARAMAMFRELMAEDAVDWAEKIEFQTRTAGTRTATRKKVLVHALVHGIRHWAQLATLMRQHGLKPGWMMDFMVTRAME